MAQRRMTRTEARAFVARWQRFQAMEREELRAASLELKLRQVAALMASVDHFGWRPALSEGEQEVRTRWQRLRSLYGV